MEHEAAVVISAQPHTTWKVSEAISKFHFIRMHFIGCLCFTYTVVRFLFSACHFLVDWEQNFAIVKLHFSPMRYFPIYVITCDNLIYSLFTLQAFATYFRADRFCSFALPCSLLFLRLFLFLSTALILTLSPYLACPYLAPSFIWPPALSRPPLSCVPILHRPLFSTSLSPLPPPPFSSSSFRRSLFINLSLFHSIPYAVLHPHLVLFVYKYRLNVIPHSLTHTQPRCLLHSFIYSISHKICKIAFKVLGWAWHSNL